MRFSRRRTPTSARPVVATLPAPPTASPRTDVPPPTRHVPPPAPAPPRATAIPLPPEVRTALVDLPSDLAEDLADAYREALAEVHAQVADPDAEARVLGHKSAADQAAAEGRELRRVVRDPVTRRPNAPRKPGTVRRDEYLSPGREAEALTPGPDGLPNAKLVRERDRLLVRTPLGWINPRSRTAWRYGLHSFAIRGTGYHVAAVKVGRFTPGALVRLERESDNPHDPNAIAVYAVPGRNRSGYVPKSTAARLAPLLDAGTDFVAVSVRGSGKGSGQETPVVLVAERRLFNHLTIEHS